ncbi:MAG: GAF domain-containing protein [Candidatus Wallbacteria bacterium]|nr:GAF domain-containing protein [Candidatus Wallbacteria bacterium]
MDFRKISGKIQEILAGKGDRNCKLQSICELLKQEVKHYNWVGFYLVDPSNERELVLGPFAGTPTEHTRIHFGHGICGQAAELEETFVSQDVSRESNYLSCSLSVKAEIVLPFFSSGRIAGELDIDSHYLNCFSDDDRRFLESVCREVEKLF